MVSSPTVGAEGTTGRISKSWLGLDAQSKADFYQRDIVKMDYHPPLDARCHWQQEEHGQRKHATSHVAATLEDFFASVSTVERAGPDLRLADVFSDCSVPQHREMPCEDIKLRDNAPCITQRL